MIYWITEHTCNVGMVLGLILVVCYLFRAPSVGAKIQLEKILETILASVALITALKLFIKVFNSTEEYLGNLKSDKEAILLGSIAMFFLSVNSIAKILDLGVEKLIAKFSKSKNQVESQ
jgi:hypothetical protein